MPTYTVTATLQSEDNEPVNVVWTRDGNPFDVITSVSQILNHDLRDHEVMAGPPVLTLSIIITINHEEA